MVGRPSSCLWPVVHPSQRLRLVVDFCLYSGPFVERLGRWWQRYPSFRVRLWGRVEFCFFILLGSELVGLGLIYWAFFMERSASRAVAGGGGGFLVGRRGENGSGLGGGAGGGFVGFSPRRWPLCSTMILSGPCGMNRVEVP
jgi:hypothetical protein